MLSKIGELISVYTILLDEKNLKKPKGTLKFSKARDWILPIIPIKLKVIDSKIPNSETFFWNTLEISENTSKVNFIELNEKSNP